MERTIKPKDVKHLKDAVIIDVRRESDFLAGPGKIKDALRRQPETVDKWADALPKDRDIVIYCTRGGSVSNSVRDSLAEKGIHARYIEGGIEAWTKEEGAAK
ncbi:MAG TPA: rhodanese-like domain-containing protein [Dissulfurispiraceae bacterium]|nr:rhodanese-like domain-containing protein [Dissulfurispiraceae bacterium]